MKREHARNELSPGAVLETSVERASMVCHLQNPGGKLPWLVVGLGFPWSGRSQAPRLRWEGEDEPMKTEEQKQPRASIAEDAEALVNQVRERYGRIAREGTPCCAAPELSQIEAPVGASVSGKIGYDREQLESAPEEANLGLGCGSPIGPLRLQPGEVLLDLGSGGGLDAFIAAPLVGTEGKVIGVDMTQDMIDRARRGAEKGGFPQVEFRLGRLEALPVEDASVDAVTSNCVINLVPDKSKVFAEIGRVLKPGGRLVISDIVLERPLPAAITEDLLAYVGCVAGAMVREPYFQAVEAAGLRDIEMIRDVDYLDLIGETVPEDLARLMSRTRVSRDEVSGIVRSVTYRAWKR